MDFSLKPSASKHRNFLTKNESVVIWKVSTGYWLIKLPQLFSVRDLYRLSLTLMLIRPINLPVSLHLLETNGYYTPCRYGISSGDCFTFRITLLSLSLLYISFSGRSRSVPHWAVINVVFLHYLIFIRVFKLILVYVCMTRMHTTPLLHFSGPWM